jgi:fructosamine-3-kinase
MTTGDFAVLSHLKELGGGELLRRPREVHFSGCINESYALHCAGGDFFVKINRLTSLCTRHFLNPRCHNRAG